jgi:hypothetical protein
MKHEFPGAVPEIPVSDVDKRPRRVAPRWLRHLVVEAGQAARSQSRLSTLISVPPFQREIPMKTTTHLITIPAATDGSSCHGASQGSGRWLSRRRDLVFGGGAIVAGRTVCPRRRNTRAAALALVILPR